MGKKKYPPVVQGKRYGRLIAVSKEGSSKWLCKCDCGNTKIILGASLRSGATRSCGCLRKEKTGKRFTNHNKYEILKDKIRAYTTKGEVFYVSLESEWILKKYCWSMRSGGYLAAGIKKGTKTMPMHQMLLKDELDKPENKNKMVDHIDGNPSNNCLDNLRIVNNRQNCLNTEKRKNFGIYKTKYKNNRYQVILGKNNKPTYIGLFDTIESAREARDKWIDENDKERYKYNRN